MPRASEETLEQVILLHQQGLSHRQIQSQTGVPKSTVSRVIHRWITTGSVSRFKPGRDSPYTFSSSPSSTAATSLSSSPSSLSSSPSLSNSGFLTASFSPSPILSSSPIMAASSPNFSTSSLSRSLPNHDRRLVNGLINSNPTEARRPQSPNVDGVKGSAPADIYEAAMLLMNLDTACSRRLQNYSFGRNSMDQDGDVEGDDRDGGDDDEVEDLDEDQWIKDKEQGGFSNNFFSKELKLVRS